MESAQGEPSLHESHPIASIDIVVVTYNNESHIADCIGSILTQSGVNTRIFLGDNGSKDRTLDIVDDIKDDLQESLVLASFPENPGFGTACNRLAAIGFAEYILLLNPDTRFFSDRPRTLEQHVAQLQQSADIKAVGPMLVRASGELDHACKRMEPTLGRAIGHLSGKFGLSLLPALAKQYRAEHIQATDDSDVDAVNGAYMLVRRADYLRVGGFDERYWMYAEDLDLCARLRSDGGRIRYLGSTKVMHLKGASEPGGRTWRTTSAFWRSMGLYVGARICRRFHMGTRLESALSGVLSAALIPVALAEYVFFSSRRSRDVQ